MFIGTYIQRVRNVQVRNCQQKLLYILPFLMGYIGTPSRRCSDNVKQNKKVKQEPLNLPENVKQTGVGSIL